MSVCTNYLGESKRNSADRIRIESGVRWFIHILPCPLQERVFDHVVEFIQLQETHPTDLRRTHIFNLTINDTKEDADKGARALLMPHVISCRPPGRLPLAQPSKSVVCVSCVHSLAWHLGDGWGLVLE